MLNLDHYVPHPNLKLFNEFDSEVVTKSLSP